MSDQLPPRAALSRRRFLALAAGVGSVLALGSRNASAKVPSVSPLGTPARTPGPAAGFFELVASRAPIDLGGRTVHTWVYNDRLPGPVLRSSAGDTIRVRVTNKLPQPTTVHWHGIALRNSMDGVPDVTQPPIAPGTSFDYGFVTPDPGTYFFHPHVGLQLDYGLYAPLIVDDPADPGDYDAEWILVLDDWTHGVGRTPETILRRLARGMGMGTGADPRAGMRDDGHGGGHPREGAAARMPSTESRVLGGHAGDVAYPLYLINGRRAAAPETFRATAGQRLRLRIVNAGSDTAFRFAIAGHRLTVTHADGFPVVARQTDAVLLGMGERIDATVTVQPGAHPVVARAEGKGDQAHAVLRAGNETISRWKVPELDRELTIVEVLEAAPVVALESRVPDRFHRLRLDGDHMHYRWTINGKAFDLERFDPEQDLPVAAGERVRLRFVNNSPMWHPMHVHGHTFATVQRGAPGVRKDTVIVRPGRTVDVDFDADNPGTWMVHCHNVYHQEAGMMTGLAYVQAGGESSRE